MSNAANPNEVITKNLGHASAYALAKSKGYTGTEEEFATLMASYATVAQNAAASASAAASSASEAESSKVAAASSASSAESSKVAAAESETAANASKVAAALSETNAATSASNASTSAGSASASASAAAASAAAAKAVQDSIPEDYSQLDADVTDLKSHVSMITGVDEITGWINGGYINTGKSIGETVDISAIESLDYCQCVIIPCNTNDELVVSGAGGTAPRLWCFLDADNKVISCSSANATADKLKLTIPLNTAKVVLNRNIRSNIPCYIGKTPKSTSDAVINFLDYHADAKNAYMCNVLNKDTIIEGGHYTYNNTWVSDPKLYSSDYIPCKSGEIYSLNYLQDILLYDISKNFIGRIATYRTKTRHAFKVPTYERPVCFFRVYGLINQKETDGVYNTEEYIGDSKSIPYGNIYPINPKTKNKIIHTFGDSRTWYDLNNYVEATTTPGELCIGYQSWMRRYLTTAVYNHGVSGYTTPQINNVVHNTNISDADVITLAGGINDFLQSTKIGTIQSIGGTFNTDTVYGALQSMIEYILGTKPDVKLMLINPFTGWLKNDTVEFPETYAKIKRDVAELYKLPLLDLTKVCGFNSLNRDAFYCDDMTKVSYRLHLNNKGNEIIGQMISSFVSNGF